MCGLYEKSGHQAGKDMKIQPDPFLTWNKNFKAFEERGEKHFHPNGKNTLKTMVAEVKKKGNNLYIRRLS